MGAFGNTEWATQSFVYATVSSGSGGGGGGGGGICFIRGTFAAAKTDDSQHR
jgi:hypothetical protein